MHSLPARFRGAVVAGIRSPRVAAVLVLVLVACGTPAILRSTGGVEGAMRVAPPAVSLEPVGDGDWGTFTLTVTGRDSLTGLLWQPGVGSHLDIEERDIDPGWVAGPDGGVLELRYTLSGGARVVGDSGASETGLPPDDGVLRLFFSEHPAVDVWVEVMW